MNRGIEEPGLVDALNRLAGTLLRTVHSRIELASIELAETRTRVVVMLIAGLLAGFLFGGAIVALSAWVAVSLWDRLGPAVLGWMALAYGGGGLLLIWWLRARLAAEPPWMEHTLAELQQDAALLRNGPRARPSPPNP